MRASARMVHRSVVGCRLGLPPCSEDCGHRRLLRHQTPGQRRGKRRCGGSSERSRTSTARRASRAGRRSPGKRAPVWPAVRIKPVHRGLRRLAPERQRSGGAPGHGRGRPRRPHAFQRPARAAAVNQSSTATASMRATQRSLSERKLPGFADRRRRAFRGVVVGVFSVDVRRRVVNPAPEKPRRHARLHPWGGGPALPLRAARGRPRRRTDDGDVGSKPL